MANRTKIIAIVTTIVFTICLIGLTIGMILTANMSDLKNSVNISYSSDNYFVGEVSVSKTIYTDATSISGTKIQLNSNGDTTITNTVRANQKYTLPSELLSNTDLNTSEKNGRVEYLFELNNINDTDTANQLQMLATITNKGTDTIYTGNDSDYIVITMLDYDRHSDYYTDSKYKYETNQFYCNIGYYGESMSFVVCIYLDDEYSNEYEFDINIQLGYDIPNQNDGKENFFTIEYEYSWDDRNGFVYYSYPYIDFNCDIYLEVEQYDIMVDYGLINEYPDSFDIPTTDTKHTLNIKDIYHVYNIDLYVYDIGGDWSLMGDYCPVEGAYCSLEFRNNFDNVIWAYSDEHFTYYDEDYGNYIYTDTHGLEENYSYKIIVNISGFDFGSPVPFG